MASLKLPQYMSALPKTMFSRKSARFGYWYSFSLYLFILERYH